MKKLFALFAILILTAACQITPTPAPATDTAANRALSVPADTTAPTAAPTPETPFPPLVLQATPENGAEVALDAPIELTFDQPMDTASVEKAFRIEPPIDGSLAWVNDTTVRFVPSQGYQRGKRYRVIVAESAKSAVGLPLNRPAEITFETVGYLAVSSVQPAPDSDEILPNTTVTVLFNRPVVPLTAIENQTELPQPLTFTPPVRGDGQWLNTSIYQFTPKERFAPATEYTARVAAGLVAVDGSVMEDNFVWHFRTESPQVVANYPADGAHFVSPTPVIQLAFNQQMDHASVETAFRLRNAATGKPVAGTFAWAEEGLTQPIDPYSDDYFYGSQFDSGEGPAAVGVETVSFTPTEPLALGAPYTIELADTAAAALGDNTTLPHMFAASFTVIPPLEIIHTTPRDGSTRASPWDSLQVSFSAPVDPASIKIGENIIISPPVTPTDVYTYFWDSNTEMDIGFPTTASSAYTVTLKGSIASRYGQPLGSDTTIHWQTTAFEPMLYLHSPGDVAAYSTITDTMAYFTVRNVSAVNFALYRLPEDDFVKLNGENRWDFIRGYAPVAKDKLREWTVFTEPELNQNAIYGTHLAEDGGALSPGLYYLKGYVLSGDVYPEAENLGELPEFTQVIAVSDANITVKAAADQTMAWLTDLRTAEPVAGANLRFRTEYDSLGETTTDRDGVGGVRHTETDPWTPRFVFSDEPFAVVSTDWRDGIERWNFGIDTEDYLQPYATHLYTDRAIYRPGQTVFFKGIIRADDDAHYSLPNPRPVDVTVYDWQGQVIYAKTLSLNENGTFNGQFDLADEADLGSYFIEAVYEDESFGVDFSVAAYRKPEFLVDVSTDKPEYRNGDTILLTARASYFFGGAVKNAPVRYSILSEDYFFRYTGKGWYDFTDYDFSRNRSEDFIPGFGELIMDGDATTDADGTFSLEVPADIAKRIASQRFTLEVTVTDPDSNQQVSNRTTAIVHKGDFYVGLRPEKYVGTAGKDTMVNVLTVDWHSQPVPQKDVTIIFNEHRWYSVKVQSEGGGYYWESQVEDTPVATVTVTTDGDGTAQATFIPETGGVYKIVAIGVDDAGNRVQSSTFMWVSGSEYINWRQENNDRIELVADKKEYRVGDVATILIPHPYSGTVRALVTQERGHIYQTEVMELPTNSEQIQIPITADMLPNMFVSVVILHPSTADDPVPSFKVGYAQLPIDVSEKEINITLTPDRDRYLPGDTVTYSITATDAHGNPVEAEFSLAVVDKAILTLAPDNSGSLLDRFWRERGLGVSTAAGLAISAERVNATVASEAKGGGGGGFEQAFETVRGEFKDTAFWLANFTTDANGHGSVSVKLPDNLTTWVLTARGISKDTLVGDDSIEIVSTKPLLVRPVAPRFFVVGDEAQLKMIVQNNTENALTVDTFFEAVGAELVDTAATDTLTIDAGKTATVVYPVKIGLADKAVLRFGAKGGDFEDAVEITLPVYHHSTPETVGTAGVLDADGARLEGIALPRRFDPSQGQLTVTIEPSLAAGMRNGLTYLEHYPYECTEQVVSRFLPNVVTYRAYQQLGLDNPALAERLSGLVSLGLQKLYARQNTDGGWGWWSADKSNPNISAYVLLGMVEAQKADFAVEESVIKHGAKFLLNHLVSPKDVQSNWQANQQAFILYVLAETGNGDLGRTVALFDQREKLDTFGKAYLAMAFGLLEPKNPDRAETLVSDITGEAIVSATGAHWEESQPDFYNMNTDTRSTAIVIAALSRLDPQNAIAPNAVRWLMSVREHGGTWETTQETAWAIIGLTDWMVATGELNGNYAWDVSLNGQSLGDGTVNAANIDQPVSMTAAVRDLLADTVNRLVIERTPANGATTGDGRLYYTAHLEYYKPVEDVKSLERGIIVARQYSLASDPDGRAITSARVGDIITVKVTLIAPHDLHYVLVEDPIPAGTEGIDRSLLTTSVVGERPELNRTDRPHRYGWGWWYFSHTELRDEKAALFATYLPKGTYEYTYQIRASLPGQYRVIPTHAEEMYFPEVFGRGDGGVFTVTE